ncbi:MAG TPA: hypothetical protein VFR67_10550 [Pilimelia sp.]|nr:hypothetical protein [Pilimelia sp.]
MWKVLVGLAVAVTVVIVVAWRRTAADRVLFLRRSGLVLMAVWTVVGGAWIAAEMFADPGGWPAVVLIAAWLAPLAALLAVTWYRPDVATVLLGAFTAAAVGAGLWAALDPESWRAFENDNGPVRAIVTFVLAAPIALLGWTRPRPAGVLLVVLGVVPVALAAAAAVSGLGSLIVVSVLPVLTGTLYLLADTLATRASATPTTPTATARR